MIDQITRRDIQRRADVPTWNLLIILKLVQSIFMFELSTELSSDFVHHNWCYKIKTWASVEQLKQLEEEH